MGQVSIIYIVVVTWNYTYVHVQAVFKLGEGNLKIETHKL